MFYIRFRFFLFFLFFLFLSLLSIFFIYWWWNVLFNFSLSLTPSHNITYEYECFIVFKGFFHHFESKLYILKISLLDIVHINFAFLSCFFGKKFWFFSFEDFFYSVWFYIKIIFHGTHMLRVLSLFLNQLIKQSSPKGGIEIVNEILF